MSTALSEPEAVAEAVRASRTRVLPVGGATKPALSTAPDEDVTSLDLSALSGMLDYDPAELTFTALAGTRVAEVSELLAEHEQHLPFDPPLAAAGATLGGVVAAGTSGPGALRHGGVRDFVIGVRFVDGTGTLVSGGGKVVKNAAGFDLPKLMVGSMGRLGVIVQLSFKVFPRPRTTRTVTFGLGATAAALDAVGRLAGGPLELEALELEPGGRLLVRLGGDAEAMNARVGRVAGVVGADPEEVIEDDAELWAAATELAWVPSGARLIRVALTAHDAIALEAAAAAAGAVVRLSLAASVAWVAWPPDVDLAPFEAVLRDRNLAGVVLTGPPGQRMLGAPRGGAFAERLRTALDPDGRFLEP